MNACKASAADPFQQAAAWASITAVMAGVDTIQLWHKRKLPRKVFDRLIALGAYYPRRQPIYGRLLRIHHLNQAMLEAIEQIAAVHEMVVNRIDIRFDFSFKDEAARMRWHRTVRPFMWIPYSRNVERQNWDNGNCELHHYANRKGGKPARNVLLCRDPKTTTGVDDPTTRLEVRFNKARTVRRYFPVLSKVMDTDAEDLLRQHFCLHRAIGNVQIPELPATVEWEVKGKNLGHQPPVLSIKCARHHSQYTSISNNPHKTYTNTNTNTAIEQGTYHHIDHAELEHGSANHYELRNRLRLLTPTRTRTETLTMPLQTFDVDRIKSLLDQAELKVGHDRMLLQSRVTRPELPQGARSIPTRVLAWGAPRAGIPSQWVLTNLGLECLRGPLRIIPAHELLAHPEETLSYLTSLNWVRDREVKRLIRIAGAHPGWFR